ncbi:uncharacterized protein VTP21DRAFT_5816 [Calcarisporiella thermophila]|uniref:uncharacterized protein n=1 Tax=Calcarisporiella thermophila TaxID=911321 RepID=UPI003743D554
MSLRSLRVPNPSAFHEIIQSNIAQLNEGKRLFVLFFGTEDPQTGESWCPDCVIAEPAIRSSLSKSTKAQGKDTLLIECPVGPRSEWKNNPTHPYRVDSATKVTGVPTLIRWTQNGAGDRLVEEECADAARLATFFS